jgi:hypothetical protein
MPTPAWTAADFLDLWRRLYPRSYTRPIEEENEGEGLDTIAAFAAIWARVDRAIDYTIQRYYLKPSTLQTGEPAAGLGKAAGTLTLARTAPVNFALTLIVGNRLQAFFTDTFGVEREGALYEVTTELTMPVGSVGPFSLEVQAISGGFSGNVVKGSVRAFVAQTVAEIEDATISAGLTEVTNAGARDPFFDSHVGRYFVFDTTTPIIVDREIPRRITAIGGQTITVDVAYAVVGVPAAGRVLAFNDLGITVVQPDTLTGGRDAWLDALGEERRIFRRLGESDDAYRDRIAELPDTISPGAINRIARRILDPFGVKFVLKETRDPSTWPGFIYDESAYDVGTPFDGYVGGCEITTAFVLCVGLSAAGEFGAPYDATLVPNPNAWDVMAFDGFAIEYAAALGALYDQVNAARAAGVCFDIVLDLALL